MLKTLGKILTSDTAKSTAKIIGKAIYDYLEEEYEKEEINTMNLSSVLKTLDSLEGMTPKKRRKVVENIIFSNSVMTTLFMPSKKEKELSVDFIEKFYEKFSTTYAVNAVARMCAKMDPGDMDRTAMCFLTSLTNVVIEKNNDTLKEADRMRAKKAISLSEVNELTDVIAEMNEDIVNISKFIKRNAKHDATRLADISGLPRYICILGLTTVPDVEFIDKYKVGFYLNSLLNQIYSDINEFGKFNTANVKWRKYFAEIFGEDNVLECCTFILLEGVNRIEKYSNSKDVKDCWNSLTDFALEELDFANDANRNHMIELYIKRIERMFQNNAFDLRVDLRKLSDVNYPKLAKSIAKYADKITSIIEKGSKMLDA